MKRLTTCRFICFNPSVLPVVKCRWNGRRVLLLLLISLGVTTLYAQEQQEQQPAIPAEIGVQQSEKAPLLSGIAVGADIVGFIMKVVGSKFANMEVNARLNILDKYFPVAELGIGDCHREGAETGNTFSTTSPYMRFGIDYNFNKKHNGNRLFGIFRYGFSSFTYDIGNDNFTDPVYGNSVALQLNSQKATAQWLEFGVGVETKLWSIVRLGWSMRYKSRISMKSPDEGTPYFIPGFGKNDSNGWGGTVNLIFDVGKTTKKTKSKVKSNKVAADK
ncbi:MAG: hypothetical protein J1F27_04300 [Prevotellaceae bacterium]|nr:hypothetical protein [Prevotellaceae bacterium]